MIKYSKGPIRSMKNKNKKSANILVCIFALSILCQTLISGNNLPLSTNDNQNLINSSFENVKSAALPVQPNMEKEVLENGLGQIEITDAVFYPDPDEDDYILLDNENITHIYHDSDFVRTIENATTERANGAEVRTSNIRIQMYESIIWGYNSSISSLDSFEFGYIPDYPIVELIEIRKFGSGLVANISNKFYLDEINGLTGIFYDFEEEYIHNNEDTVELIYIYEIYVPITEWSITTKIETEGSTWTLASGNINYIENVSEIVEQEFKYSVRLGDESNPLSMNAQFKITFPNPEDIYGLIITDFNNNEGNPYPVTKVNNIISMSSFVDSINLMESDILEATFHAKFEIQFLEVVDGLWCEDRLVSNMNVRERDYKFSIVDGPDDLMISYFGFNETSIHFNQVNKDFGVKSALGRTAGMRDMNTTIVGENSSVTVYTNASGIVFLMENTNTPFEMFPGEVDIFTIRYRTNKDLKIIVTDSIRSPLSNLKVKIFVGGRPYGTLVSNFVSYPLAAQTSDEFGRITVRNVPMGNYSIVILDSDGNPRENITANSMNDFKDNIIITSIVHFPSVILVYLGFSCVFIFAGFTIYKKNK